MTGRVSLPMDEDLKLLAVDAEDLAVLSAHLQDAELQVGRIAFLPKQKRFVMVVERIDRSMIAFAAGQGESSSVKRKRTGLHFEGVRQARHQHIDPSKPDQMLHILAVTFTPDQLPAGQIMLHCAEGRMIRLDVDFVEARLADMPADSEEI